jgi:OOP family OmpA-OmpF porin
LIDSGEARIILCKTLGGLKMRFVWNFLFLAMAVASAANAAGAPPLVNVAAFGNGALIESSTSDYPTWEASYLLDESPHQGWASLKGAKAPFTIVISLSERSEIQSFAFDDSGADGLARAAKDIDVSVSDVSATSGFVPVLSATLKNGPTADNQNFPLKTAVKGRWIRLVIKTNYGAADYSELMDIRAMGHLLTQSPPPTGLSGTYSSANYGDFHLLQKGAELSGCYTVGGGVVHGGLESHLMRLTWTEPTNGTGPAVMVLNRDGKGFAGWWRHAADKEWHANWALKKISNDVGSCAGWNPNSNSIAGELKTNGKSVLYGINFDTDSARLRADASPEIAELLAVLKAVPTMHVSIDGHTDSTGNAGHNLDLSKNRAESVKTALIAGGIAAERMTTQGFGQSKPVAPNDTEIGRAQNRRVEVIRK